MNELQVGEHDLLKYLKPDTFIGALAYLVIFILVAQLLSRTLRAAVHAAMTRKGTSTVPPSASFSRWARR